MFKLIHLDCLHFKYLNYEEVAYKIWCIYCSIKGISSELASEWKPYYSSEYDCYTITPSNNIKAVISNSFTYGQIVLGFQIYDNKTEDIEQITNEIKLQFKYEI